MKHVNVKPKVLTEDTANLSKKEKETLMQKRNNVQYVLEQFDSKFKPLDLLEYQEKVTSGVSSILTTEFVKDHGMESLDNISKSAEVYVDIFKEVSNISGNSAAFIGMMIALSYAAEEIIECNKPVEEEAEDVLKETPDDIINAILGNKKKCNCAPKLDLGKMGKCRKDLIDDMPQDMKDACVEFALATIMEELLGK